MKKHKKIINGCVAVSLTAMLLFPNPTKAEQISDLKTKMNQLAGSIKAAEKNKDQIKSQQVVNSNALENIKHDIDATKNEILDINNQINESEKKIKDKENEIELKQKEYEKRKKVFDDRLVDIYKNGDTSILDVLFGSSDFSDMLTRFEYMNYIAAKDKNLLEEVKSMKEVLEAEKNLLNDERNHLSILKTQVESKVALLKQQESEKQETAQKLMEQEKELSKQIARMNADSAAIGNQIAAIQRQQAAIRAASRKSFHLSSTKSAQGFFWPVPSSHMITSPYGYRSTPFGGYGEFHMGVDIAAPMGTPVVASRSGTIIIQVYHPSYGNYIVIDHGDSFSTVYAHLSGFACSAGQEVRAGQVIGFIGTTGASTGPHLHFEVRINGQHTNPLDYIGS